MENGGFEDDIKGWRISEKVPMSSVKAEAAHEGKMGLRVEDNDDVQGSSVWGSQVPVEPGVLYRLSFWARTAGSVVMAKIRSSSATLPFQ